MSKNTGRRNNSNTADASKELTAEQIAALNVEKGQSTELVEGQGEGSEGTGTEGTGAITGTLETKEVKEAPKAPNFASNSAPASTPRVVKLFTELVTEYAKHNTQRQMDQVKAKQVTRGLATAFQQLTKLNANDTKACLKVLDSAIRADKVGAFSEGVMFRHVTSTTKPRLVIDMLNLAKRYVSLGDGKANITKVVDVGATSEHYTSKVVAGAIVDFYK